MKKINFAMAAVISLCLHLLAIYGIFVYINGKAAPIFYFWADIVRQKDYLLRDREMTFAPGINFSVGRPYKDYFLSFMPLAKSWVLTPAEKANILPSALKETTSFVEFHRAETAYLYLWERPKGMSYTEEESATYKVYVSPYGKVMFSFPEKLPLNSYGNLISQEYIRESAMFLHDKFYWTKLDGIVK